MDVHQAREFLEVSGFEGGERLGRYSFLGIGPRRVLEVQAELRAELESMKRFGFNALRTAHYPNDPALLDLADSLGLYVIAEADIESHAFWGTICDDPRYLPAWVDRVARMAIRDKNHCSVIAWSLGNESGYGANHDAAAAWLRRYDPSRPLHYEGAIKWDWASPQGVSDLTCPMYPTIASIATCPRCAWIAAADMNTAPTIRKTEVSSCQSVDRWRK